MQIQLVEGNRLKEVFDYLEDATLEQLAPGTQHLVSAYQELCTLISTQAPNFSSDWLGDLNGDDLHAYVFLDWSEDNQRKSEIIYRHPHKQEALSVKTERLSNGGKLWAKALLKPH